MYTYSTKYKILIMSIMQNLVQNIYFHCDPEKIWTLDCLKVQVLNLKIKLLNYTDLYK